MARFPDLRGRAFIFLMFFWSLWFMTFSSRTVFAPLMPIIEDEFGILHAKAGSLITLSSLGYGISLFVSGIFAGSVGYKKAVALSFLVNGLAFLAIPYAQSFSMLYILLFISGLSTGIYIPSVIPLITQHYSERSWGKAIAIHDSAASTSIFCAPLIVLVFLKYFYWKNVFIVFGITCLVCFVAILFAVEELKTKRPTLSVVGDLMRQSSLWVLSFIWIGAAGASLGLYFILPLYLTKELLLDIRYAEKIFALSRMGGVFVAAGMGFVIDRFSLKRTMFVVLFLSGILTICLTFRTLRFLEIFLFLQASIILGFFPISLVATSRMFRVEHRSMATGFTVTVASIFGVGIIPFLLGLAGDHLSFRFGILLLGILLVATSGCIRFLKDDR